MNKDDEEKAYSTDPTSLGNLARIFETEVTGIHVIKALKHAKAKPGTKIGEALVETGAINEEQKEELLRKQEELRLGKTSRADVMKMLDYATKKTSTASDKLADFLKGISRKP